MPVLLDNGLRLLVLAATKSPSLITIAQTADACNASHAHVAKAANRLVRGGFLTSTRGRFGGLQLARCPEAICLADVADAMRGLGRAGKRRDELLVTWRRIQKDAMRSYVRHLEKRTLADLLSDSVMEG